MTNVDKVIEAINCLLSNCSCTECEYHEADSCVDAVLLAASELLKEQKKTLELQHSAMRGSADMIELLFKKFDEIVLCKNCKYRGNKLCPFYQKYQGEKYDDWFCADGKRKSTQTNAKKRNVGCALKL